MKFLILAVLALLLASCHSFKKITYADFNAKPTQSLRVVVYNMNGDEPDWRYYGQHSETIKALKFVHADVVMAQEVNEHWHRMFEDHFARDYKYRKYRIYHGGSGLAFLSKYPIKEIKYIHSPIGWYPAWIVIIKTPSGPVQFLNVHLLPQLASDATPDMPKYPFIKRGHFRKKEIQCYYSQLNPRMTTIIGGDFNEGVDGLSAAWLREKGLIDASQLLPYSIGYSWYWPIGFITLTNRYERMFAYGNLKIQQVQVLHEGYSDHYPFVVDYVWD